MENKDFDGLSELELISRINKKKSKYCAMALQDLEELQLDKTDYKAVRKIFLDNMNGLVRGVFSLIGIDIEGNTD